MGYKREGFEGLALLMLNTNGEAFLNCYKYSHNYLTFEVRGMEGLGNLSQLLFLPVKRLVKKS